MEVNYSNQYFQVEFYQSLHLQGYLQMERFPVQI